MSTTTENVNDELSQTIKDSQDKEISYILEASAVDDKRSKYLAKKNEYKVRFGDGHEETLKRKPITSRQNKEIDDLRSAFAAHRYENTSKITKITVNGKEYDNLNDILYSAFIKTADYCLGLSQEKYEDAIWEDDEEYMKNDVYGLRSVLGACLLRAVHGSVYFPKP